MAKGDIVSTFYREEQANFTFDKYMSIHRNVFNGMVRANNYTETDDTTRVRRLLGKMSTSNIEIATSIATVKANPNMRNGFEAAVDFIAQSVRSTSRQKRQ